MAEPFSKELGEAICSAIAAGHSLRTIHKSNPDLFPAPSTICLWVIRNEEGFAEQYATARKIQAELLADELFSIADDKSGDVTGELEMPNPTAVLRDRLRVDTRKWYLSKVLPKIYGDKLNVEHDVSDNLAEIISKGRKRLERVKVIEGK